MIDDQKIRQAVQESIQKQIIKVLRYLLKKIGLNYHLYPLERE